MNINKLRVGQRVLLAACSEEEYEVASPEQEALIIHVEEPVMINGELECMIICQVTPEDADDDGVRELNTDQVLRILEQPTPARKLKAERELNKVLPKEYRKSRKEGH